MHTNTDWSTWNETILKSIRSMDKCVRAKEMHRVEKIKLKSMWNAWSEFKWSKCGDIKLKSGQFDWFLQKKNNEKYCFVFSFGILFRSSAPAFAISVAFSACTMDTQTHTHQVTIFSSTFCVFSHSTDERKIIRRRSKKGIMTVHWVTNYSRILFTFESSDTQCTLLSMSRPRP